MNAELWDTAEPAAQHLGVGKDVVYYWRECWVEVDLDSNCVEQAERDAVKTPCGRAKTGWQP